MRAAKSNFRVLLLDDFSEARSLIFDFLSEAGFLVKEVELSSELLYELKAQDYDVLFLDIELGDEASVGETYGLLKQLFPRIDFPHERVLKELNIGNDAPVSGFYLLPMVKAIKPNIKVLMLTGAWRGEEDEHFLRDWGSYVTVQKLAPDEAFSDREKVRGLDGELVRLLNRIAKESAEEL